MSKSRGTLHHRARLARPPAGRVPALLLRVAPRRRRRGPRPQPRRLRRQGELRHRRQARQHREPLRRLHRAGLGGQAGGRAAGRGAVRRVRRGRRAHRGALRRPRPRRRDARDHGAHRPRQPLHRPAEALAHGEGSGAGRRSAGRLHAGPQPVPRAGDLPEARHAEARCRRREVPRPAAAGAGPTPRRRCSARRSTPTSRSPRASTRRRSRRCSLRRRRA